VCHHCMRVLTDLNKSTATLAIFAVFSTDGELRVSNKVSFRASSVTV